MNLIMKDFSKVKPSIFSAMATAVKACHFHNKFVDRMIDYHELKRIKNKLDDKSLKINKEMKKLEIFLGIKNL